MADWVLTYEGFDPDEEALREALCTLGNGYLATRGAAPEATAGDVHYPGTYLAGCYNRLTSTVSGREVSNEDLVNVPNWLVLAFCPDGGEWFSPGDAELLAYTQRLELRTGVLTRHVRYTDKDGRVTAVTQRRLVHMDDPHLAALETTFLAENWSGRLQVRSALDGRVTNAGVARYRGLNTHHLTPVTAGTDGVEGVWLEVATSSSHVRIAQAARTRIRPDHHPHPVTFPRQVLQEPGYVAQDLSVALEQGVPVTVEKVVATYTSRDRAIGPPAAAARQAARDAGDMEELLERHMCAWDHLWQRARLDVPGDAGNVLDLHVFHVLQTLSPHTVDLDAGVPARGLHGEAYRGHIFWDELFVLPYLNLRFPEISRAALRYRHRRLPAARRAARQAGYRGAMFPWQSGSTGEEETQTLHLNPRSGRWLPDNSHLQRHVGVAIAYNVWKYYEASADLDFLCTAGGELLLEIARFWASAATYNRMLDRYEITGVVGPDEYHEAYPDSDRPGLDNNAYTNVMAAWVLRRALDLTELLPEHRRGELLERLALSRRELDHWERVASRMRVCFDASGVISQFEGYEKLEELDWERYRATYGIALRLDRILEAEGDSPNRYKASKQADVLMLFYLLSVDELRELLGGMGYELAPDAVPRIIDYYLDRTSHGSTLSGVVHAWVLARANRPESWRLFTEALASDLHDVQGGTTPEGVHLGAMAGTVDLAQRCFTGLETRGDVLWFSPSLPAELTELSFALRYRGHWGLTVRLTHDRLRVSLPPSEAGPVRVGMKGRVLTVEPGDTAEFPL